MSGARRGPNKTHSVIIGPVTAIASPVTVGDLDVTKPHCFAGVKFFADALGATPAVPTLGTVLIEIQTLNNEPNFEPAPGGTVDASGPATVTWAGNTLKVRATPTSVDVATHYRIVITCNET